MEKVASDDAAGSPKMTRSAIPEGWQAPRPTSVGTGTFEFGLPVSDVLGLSSLSGARVLAGAEGLDRLVTRLNVMEVPDILPWVKPHELLLTTGYPLRDTVRLGSDGLAGLVAQLNERGISALGVKLGRYLHELPEEMLAMAEELDLPLIQLAEDVAFDDILNQVLTDVLNQKAKALARSEEVHRALVQIVLSGGGLKEISDELLHLLGGVIQVTDGGGQVVVVAGDAALAERSRGSCCFTKRGRLRSGRAAALKSKSCPEHQHLVVRVVVGHQEHGAIVAFDPLRRLDEDDVHVLERGATVAALAITKQLAVSAVEAKYRGDFLRDLLAGRAGPPSQAIKHAESLGWDLKRNLVLAVSELDTDSVDAHATMRDLHSAQDRLVSAWSMALVARDPMAVIVGYSHEVIIIMGFPDDGDINGLTAMLAKDGLRDLTHGGRRTSCSTGVSRLVEGVASIPRAYEQARNALNIGRHLNGAGAITHFDHLGLFRLLSLVPDSAESDAFIVETLGPLADEDTELRDLRNTLIALLDANLNVAETARRLHFHYNTLRYRIGTLEKLLGPFTEDPHLRRTIDLALQMQRLRRP